MNSADIEILSNQIDCRNRVNAKAKEISEKLKNFFAPLKGKKITKDSNSKFTAALSKKIDELIAEDRKEFSIYFTFLYGSIYCSVKSSYKVNNCSVDYVTREFFVVGFDKHCGAMTEEVRDIGEFKTYTVDDVVSTWEKIKEAERLVSALKSEVCEIKFRY